MSIQLSLWDPPQAATTSQSTSSIPVPGLRYFPDFITLGQEKSLLEAIDSAPWRQDLQRRVQQYGYRYDYKARTATKDMYLGVLPEWIQSIAKRLYWEKLMPVIPDQAIINEYEPGQGISAHIDGVYCFGDTVVSLSLGSGCLMKFASDSLALQYDLYLESRSLVVLQSEARYKWTHSIAPRKNDYFNEMRLPRSRRISITFREIRLEDR